VTSLQNSAVVRYNYISVSSVSSEFLTTAFPRFQNSRRSERRHFRDFSIPVVPDDGISAISEFLSFLTTAFLFSQFPQCF
jgi:hypothetical protein